MGKNRPPKKVREILVDLEKLRNKFQCVSDPETAAAVRRLKELIACTPDDYDRFMEEAYELIQSLASTETGNDGSTELSRKDDCSAWNHVCQVRSSMHATLRHEAEHETQDVSAGNDTAGAQQPPAEKQRHAHASQADMSRRNQNVPIVPHISLAFHGKAITGSKRFTCPHSATLSSSKLDRADATLNAGESCIVWIRPFDLRIHDNPALTYAATLKRVVHLVFAWGEEEDAAQGKWRLGGTAAGLWLHHALASLNSDFQRWYGQKIIYVKSANCAEALWQVVEATGARSIVTSKGYDLAGRAADRAVKESLVGSDIEFKQFNSFLLNDVDNIRMDMNESRGAFGTLVPFLFACNAQRSPAKPEAYPASLLKGSVGKLSMEVELTGLCLLGLPLRRDGSIVDWASPIVKEWTITEEGALTALRAFLKEKLSKYEEARHLADASAVARISPFLRFGMLSCRTMYWEAKAANAPEVSKTFWRRLVWRDLAYWQLALFPRMSDEPIRAHYSGQQWNTSKDALKRWCQGRTGYPIADAGMRELWKTGWMSQNVRMVVALLLVEYLNINWIEGARWFHHTLVDADPAINPMMWQNAGKSGLDQWNFTMHPAEFGRRMDPSGDYVRRWCPELRSLPARFIHCPWEAPARLQKHITPDVYPDRIVEDLEKAAQDSRNAIVEQRSRRRDCNDNNGYDMIVLPKGSTTSNDGRRTRLFTKRELRLPTRAKGYDDDRWAANDDYQPEKRRSDFNLALGDFMRAA